MKTTVRLLAIVAALPGFLCAQSVNQPALEPVGLRDHPIYRPQLLPLAPPDGRWAEIPPAPEPEEAPPPKIPPHLTVPDAAPRVPTMSKKTLALVHKAQSQFDRRNFVEAEKLYTQALAKTPKNAWLLSHQAACQLYEGHWATAGETLAKAIAIAPKDDWSHCTLGIIKFRQRIYSEAMQEFDQALAINPKSVEARNCFGMVASQKGWPEVAQKELESAIKMDPACADAHFNLAIVLASKFPQDKDAAREHYERALKLGTEPDPALVDIIK